MTTETKADEFKVGDQVWCTLYGKGKVTANHKWEASDEYPLKVNYCNVDDYNYYTLDGKFSKEGPRALFFSEPKIVASVVRPFVPTLVGKRVAVQEPACHDIVINISWEDQNKFGNDNHTFDKEKCVAFELSNENLLK